VYWALNVLNADKQPVPVKNRMITLPITKQAKQQERKIVLAIAQNNGFPLHIIHSLKKRFK
jgi:hypothetical protein